MRLRILGLMLILLSTVSCDPRRRSAVSEERPALKDEVTVVAPAPELNVGYAIVEGREFLVQREIPGRVVALRTADVRAKVSGQVVDQLYREGRLVQEGDTLFLLDRTKYELNYQNEQLQLQKAQAAVSALDALIERNARNTADPVAQREQAEILGAKLSQASATVSMAELRVLAARNQLEGTRVQAPISGFVGKALVGQGSYVTEAQTPLAVVQQLNPIAVELNASEGMQGLAGQMFKQVTVNSDDATSRVKIKLGDRLYPQEGVLELADLKGLESGSMVTARAIVPNPDFTLLPGNKVSVLFQDQRPVEQLMIPRAALRSVEDRRALVWVIGAKNMVQSRAVTLERQVDDGWTVTQGLSEGERVAVEWLQRLRHGQVVNPTLAIPRTNSNLLSE